MVISALVVADALRHLFLRTGRVHALDFAINLNMALAIHAAFLIWGVVKALNFGV